MPTTFQDNAATAVDPVCRMNVDVAAIRSENGYRIFNETDIHKLRFIQRARGLGFSVENCRALLSLYEDGHRTAKEVKSIAVKHLEEIDAKIIELGNLRDVLTDLVDHCAGDFRPDCPIIDDLAGALELSTQNPNKPLKRLH